DPDLTFGGAELSPCRRFVATDDEDRPRAHVLLLADDLPRALLAVVRKGLGRVLEEPLDAARLRRRHRRRQVDQPAWIERPAAHHLEGRSRVLFPDRHLPAQARFDDPLSEHVVDVEEPALAVRRLVWLDRNEWLERLVVGLEGGDRDELALRVAKGGQAAAEGAAGVDVDRAVYPHRLGHRRVSVDDDRLAAVLLRPVIPDRKAELVRFAGRLAEQGEVPNAPGRTALEALAHPGVRDDEIAVVEHEMAD